MKLKITDNENNAILEKELIKIYFNFKLINNIKIEEDKLLLLVQTNLHYLSTLKITPEEFIASALQYNARSVVSTYNEPLITSEWAVEIFKEAKKHSLATGFVSNGNATTEALEFINPFINMYKVDLKSFNDRTYRDLGGNVEL